MNENNVRPKFVIIAILVVLLYIFLFVWMPRKEFKSNLARLSKDGKYTIGYIYKVKDTYRSNPMVYYYYYYNGQKIKGFKRSINYRTELKGDSCYVRFLPDNYKFSDILLDKPVKKRSSYPSKGWKNIPE
jgi:hypothetical protein